MPGLSKREVEFLSEQFGNGKAFEDAVKRVENGEPLAYVLGEWYFYGLTFKVDENCLIPRPDTEHIVEKAISFLPRNGVFADLCTGSGCIAISVIKNRPDVFCTAYDISDGALRKARENASLNGTSVNFRRADIFSLTLDESSLDAIVSNPPYIASDIIPTLDTVRKEPAIALDGGRDGLDFYRHIVSRFGRALKDGGAFIFEIGYDQGDALNAIAAENGFNCEITKDYGGNDRVAFLTRKNNGEKS